MYRLCVFDLDGTLADTLVSIHYSVNKTLEEFGLCGITREQCRQFIGEGAKMLIERSLTAVGDKKLRMSEPVFERYRELFDEHCTYQVRPFPGVVLALQELKRMGVKLTVLSNKPHAQTEKVVRDIFGEGLFDGVRGQMDGCPRKPDPAGALILAEQFKTASADCLYIGDTDTDMQTGVGAGMCTVGVSWGYREAALLRESGAVHIINHPQELVAIAGRSSTEIY